MRVLIFEPDLTGHHAPYLRHMIVSLKGLDQEIVVVTRRGAAASPQFGLHLQDIAAAATFEESAPSPSRDVYAFAAGQYSALKRAIANHRPDHVWVPFADQFTEYLTARMMIWGRPLWAGEVEAEGLYFRGRFAYPAERWQKQITRSASRYLIPRSPWTVLHWLDPLAYDVLVQKFPEQKARFRLMPDPVEAVTPLERTAARAALGIATDGRYAGCVGVLNRHAGAEMLLAGFRAARLESTDRLLLAGPMDDAMRDLVNRENSDLVRAGRVVTIDRHLSVEEVMRAVMACDLMCVPRPYHIGSSSFVIRAAAARRPILVSGFGWRGWAVSKFGLGWTADMPDATALGAALGMAMERAADWRLTPIGERFVRYHLAENFQAHWTARLRERLQLPPDERLVPWTTVLTQDDSTT